MNKETPEGSEKVSTKKLSVNLPLDEVESMIYMANERSQNITEVIRDSLKRERVLFDASKKGAEIIIRNQDPEKPDVIFADLEFVRRFHSK